MSGVVLLGRDLTLQTQRQVEKTQPWKSKNTTFCKPSKHWSWTKFFLLTTRFFLSHQTVLQVWTSYSLKKLPLIWPWNGNIKNRVLLFWTVSELLKHTWNIYCFCKEFIFVILEEVCRSLDLNTFGKMPVSDFRDIDGALKLYDS